LFDISHFSLSGVAQASAAEVTAQLSHPPNLPGDQDDELLAAPQTKAQVKLAKEHDRWVKPTIDKLDQLGGNCNDVAVGALRFETWSKHVQSAGQQTYFKDMIDTVANVLKERLKDCLKTTCSDCINGGNKKPSKKAVDQLLTYSAFMQSIDLLQENTADANYWRQISNKCAQTAGRPLPEPAVAACENCTKVTPVSLTCPGP
jgi:hypothetical protein